MDYLLEPQKTVPVCNDVDLFVAGGSCTGVFAAVRAARLGLKVVLVERQNCLGGMATAALVNVWHSFKDMDYKNQIIAGLTDEVTSRLLKSGAATLLDDPSLAVQFDPYRLMYELDKLVLEEKITVYFHTLCVAALTDGKDITAALIENKDGRSAIKAKFFIDATGDGDLAKYLKMPIYRRDVVQPPTPCYIMHGAIEETELQVLIKAHGKEFNLPDDFGWCSILPGFNNDFTLQANFHIFDVDCANAKDLTFAEMESRRKIYALMDLLKKYSKNTHIAASLCSLIGIRETNHFETLYKAKGWDMLLGKRYDDAVLNGTYRVDMHDKQGTVTFMYLNGYAINMKGAQRESVEWNWREKEGITGEAAKYYQIPFRVLKQDKLNNFIAAGRMLNADDMAFGALRVMVNLNQLGEAAGTAAYIALNENKAVCDINGVKVKELLIKGGSAL